MRVSTADRRWKAEGAGDTVAEAERQGRKARSVAQRGVRQGEAARDGARPLHIAMTTPRAVQEAPAAAPARRRRTTRAARAPHQEARRHGRGGSTCPGPDGRRRQTRSRTSPAARSRGAGPVARVRGTAEAEKMLKNAKDEFHEEAEEIANYTAIEALAENVGDKDTAQAGEVDPARGGADVRLPREADPAAHQGGRQDGDPGDGAQAASSSRSRSSSLALVARRARAAARRRRAARGLVVAVRSGSSSSQRRRARVGLVEQLVGRRKVDSAQGRLVGAQGGVDRRARPRSTARKTAKTAAKSGSTAAKKTAKTARSSGKTAAKRTATTARKSASGSSSKAGSGGRSRSSGSSSRSSAAAPRSRKKS